MSELNVVVVSDSQSFQTLESEWNTLLDNSNCQSVFLTWHWLYTWWVNFSTQRKLHIVAIRDGDGKLVGIGPFCICNRWGKYPIQALTFLGTSPISSEYLDIITDPNQESAVATAIFDHVFSASFDSLILTDVLQISNVCKYFEDPSRLKGFVFRKTLSEVCPYLELDSSHEVVLGNFESQLRSTIKRRTNKLKKMGAEVMRVADEAELEPNIEKLFELHQRCWSARGEAGNFSDPLIRSFHSSASSCMISRDFLRLYALQVEGKTVAALYAYQYKKTVFYYQSGFDPDWSSYSPGTVLMWLCICDAIDQGVKEFDYLRGAEFYKSLWANKCKNTYNLIIIPKERYLARLCIYLADLKSNVKSKVKRAFQFFGLLSDGK